MARPSPQNMPPYRNGDKPLKRGGSVDKGAWEAVGTICAGAGAGEGDGDGRAGVAGKPIRGESHDTRPPVPPQASSAEASSAEASSARGASGVTGNRPPASKAARSGESSGG